MMVQVNCLHGHLLIKVILFYFRGDTVHVLAGTYTSQVVISDNGADLNDLITYKGKRDSVTIEGTGLDSVVFITGSFVEWSGISVQNSLSDNILIDGENVTVSYCQLLSAGEIGRAHV